MRCAFQQPVQLFSGDPFSAPFREQLLDDATGAFECAVPEVPMQQKFSKTFFMHHAEH